VIRPHSPSLSLSAEASSAAISLNQEQLVILLTKMSSLEIGRKLARAQIDGATGCNSALTIGPCCCITSTATLCSDISCPYLTLELARFSSWSCASTSLMTICRANPVVIFSRLLESMAHGNSACGNAVRVLVLGRPPSHTSATPADQPGVATTTLSGSLRRARWPCARRTPLHEALGTSRREPPLSLLGRTLRPAKVTCR
jgi:hypothetical protein